MRRGSPVPWSICSLAASGDGLCSSTRRAASGSSSPATASRLLGRARGAMPVDHAMARDGVQPRRETSFGAKNARPRASPRTRFPAATPRPRHGRGTGVPGIATAAVRGARTALRMRRRRPRHSGRRALRPWAQRMASAALSRKCRRASGVWYVARVWCAGEWIRWPWPRRRPTDHAHRDQVLIAVVADAIVSSGVSCARSNGTFTTTEVSRRP